MEKEVITLERENCVIRIHKPDIPEEERQRRMEAFKQAAATFMKAVYRQNQGIWKKCACGSGNSQWAHSK